MSEAVAFFFVYTWRSCGIELGEKSSWWAALLGSIELFLSATVCFVISSSAWTRADFFVQRAYGEHDWRELSSTHEHSMYGKEITTHPGYESQLKHIEVVPDESVAEMPQRDSPLYFLYTRTILMAVWCCATLSLSHFSPFPACSHPFPIWTRVWRDKKTGHDPLSLS